MAKKKKTEVKVVKKKKAKKVVSKLSPRKVTPKLEKEIALDFAAKVHKKFSTMIKASILFGSQTKKTATAGSDIDIIFLIDDAAINWDEELVAYYREELGKILANNEYSRELHVNTIKLTTFWKDLMRGDPVVINVLRYGEALIDIGGFFNPIKALLIEGNIHTTPEAVHAALQRAPIHLARSKVNLLNSIEGVYWAITDSAQAALMTLGKLPPSPEHIAAMLKKSFVDIKWLKMEHIAWYREIYSLHKRIVHGQLYEIKGSEVDIWQNRCHKFIGEMTNIIDKLLKSNK